MNNRDDLIEVYCAKNEPEVRIVEAALIEAGIKCRVVGEYLAGAVGEVPAGIASSPAIWVPASEVEPAREVIRDLETPESPFRIPTWQCPKCDSEVDSGFDTCWKCLYNPRAC